MTTTLSPGFVAGGFLNDIIDHSPQSNNGPLRFNDLASAHHHWMIESLRAGMRGIGIANPNPSVGCVLAAQNQDGSWTALARGCTEAYGGRHGERVAFDAFKQHENFESYDPKTLTAFVTLEPCSHTGKQPPCVDLLLNYGIGKVIIAVGDPHALVDGKGIEKLKEKNIQVEIGLLKNESLAFNLPFFTQAIRSSSNDPIERNKLFWAGKWAQTLDGHLADDEGGWQWITGPTSRKYAHWLRQKYDAIVVGAGTVLNDFPRLDVRDVPYAGQNHPIKIIFDPKARILQCNVAQRLRLKETTLMGPQAKVVFCNAKELAAASSEWKKELCEEMAVHFISQDLHPDPIQNFKLNVEAFDFRPLRGKPLQSVFVEGGPRLLSGLLNTDSFDILHVFIAPTFLGGVNNRIAKGFSCSINKANRFVSLATASLGTDILWEMIPQRMQELVFKS